MQMKVAWYSKHLLRHIGHDYSIILQPRFLIILVRGGFALRIGPITHLALYATLLCFSTTHSKSTGDAAERNDNTGSRDTSTVHRRKSRYFTF